MPDEKLTCIIRRPNKQTHIHEHKRTHISRKLYRLSLTAFQARQDGLARGHAQSPASRGAQTAGGTLAELRLGGFPQAEGGLLSVRERVP